jgi:hypothetical protein
MKLSHKILLLYVVIGLCILGLTGALLYSRLEQERLATIYADFQT